MAILGPKTWVNPFGKKVNFSTFWTSCFQCLERRFFVLKYHKSHFPGLYYQKKKSGNNSHFWTKKHGLTLWKNVNFSTFLTSCFYSLEGVFFVLEYRKRHFPGLYCLKRNFVKMVIFRPRPWVHPLWKNGHFFDFWTFLFLQPGKAFFSF